MDESLLKQIRKRIWILGKEHVMKGLPPHLTHLNIATEGYPPYTFVEGEGTGVVIRGPMKNLIDVLAASLNFTYTLHRPADHGFGFRKEDGTWTGMIGLTRSNVTDVILGPLSVTSIRSTAIDYSVSLFLDYLGILQSRPKRSVNPFFFSRALDWRVWPGILVCLLLVLGIIMVMNRFQHIQSIPGQGHNYHFSRTLLSLLGTVFMQPLHGWNIPWNSQRILLGVWTIIITIVGHAMSDSMTAVLAVPLIKPIETINDVLALPQMGIIMEKDTAFTQAFSAATSGPLAEMWTRRLERGLELPAAQMEVTSKEGILEEGNVMVAEVTMLNTFMSKSVARGICKMYIAKEKFFPVSFAMGISKIHSKDIAPAFNEIITQIVESGIWDSWIMSELPNLQPCLIDPSHEPLQTGVITLHAFRAIFYVFLGCTAICIAAFAAEKTVSFF